MQIILLKDVDNLGLRGDVVDVARGYARNFLLPRNLAQLATPARVAELAKVERTRARHEAATTDQAREIAAVLEKAELRFDVKAGPTGSLFGSVTATDIADALWDGQKVRVDRRKIALPQPIKQVGRYAVAIEIFQDVTVEVVTLVVPEGGELPPDEPVTEEPVSEETATEVKATAEVDAVAEAETPEAEAVAGDVAEAAEDTQPELDEPSG